MKVFYILFVIGEYFSLSFYFQLTILIFIFFSVLRHNCRSSCENIFDAYAISNSYLSKFCDKTAPQAS